MKIVFAFVTLVMTLLISANVRSAQVQFEVSRVLHEKNAHAKVKIRQRARDSNSATISVNGINLSQEGSIPAANSYEMISREPSGASGTGRETHLTVTERKFEPTLPKSLSTRRDLVIPFVGDGLSSREKLLVKLIAQRKLFANGQRKTIVLTAVLDGKKIVIPATSMRNFKAGDARLHIALMSDQSTPGSKDKSFFTISLEKPIVITNR